MNIIQVPLRAKGLAYLLFLAFIASANAQTVPPKARVDNVTDEYFGVKVTDPYRWMENSKSDEMQKWIKGQADYGDNYLKRLPMRDDILKRLNEVTGASIAVGGIRQRGNLFFYTRRAPDEQDFKLYVREGLAGAERLLVDPNKVFNDGKRYSFSGWSLSQDGKYVSYLIAAGGGENGEVRVVEVATGKDLGKQFDLARFDTGSWLPDEKSFLYNRLQKLPEGAPQTDKYQKSRVYLHVLGTNSDSDKAVFGFDVNPDLKFDPTLMPLVETDPSWNFALATIETGVSPNREFYIAPLKELNQKIVPWHKIVSFDDEVGNIAVHGDDLYLLTYKNTPRFKIVRTSLSKPDLSKAETVFPTTEAVVTSLSAQRDALYVQTMDGGNYRLYRIDYKTKKAAPLNLPYEGSATMAATESNADGIYFNIVSWTKSNAHFKYNPKTGTAKPTNLIPPNPVDMSGIEFVNVKVKSYDSTMVPLVIIYKKNLKRDGANPVLMDGYGAYGIENISPIFDTSTLPWLERGGVFVWTGVRGGGEYGEEWHLAGFQKTKPNTWKDFIACAEYLIAEKYTTPRQLGIRGGSAGGILISNAIATHPELFGAAIANVGLNNILRFETTSNGIPNIPEFGSFKTEEGFKNLLAMDGYLKIKDGVKYPAVLLTTGINDPRVDPWMSAKMTARLQAATSSDKPVLLRVDYDAGHGSGTTKEQRNKQLADEYAFLFQQLGKVKR
jgi:prolyl oligopeptidase